MLELLNVLNVNFRLEQYTTVHLLVCDNQCLQEYLWLKLFNNLRYWQAIWSSWHAADWRGVITSRGRGHEASSRQNKL